jgi:hypothetical protein
MAILADTEVVKRVESPLNLFNRLRKTTSDTKTVIPSIPSPKSDDLIPDLDKKLDIAGSKCKALSVMNKVLTRLENEVEGIDTKRLPTVVAQMANALKSMEPDRAESDNRVQFVIYSPTVMTEADYGTPIEVTE